MADQKAIIEESETQHRPKKRRKGLKYNRWIVKNIPFYFFIAALALIYIANGHYADTAMRKISNSEKHLKEMEYEFKTVKQEVIFRSKESELVRAVEPLGLKELLIPPLRIIDTLSDE